MTNLKTSLISFILEKPILFRFGLILAGLMAGAVDAWYIKTTSMIVTSFWLLVLFGFSVAVYAVILTLYRIIQRVFHLGRKLPEPVRSYDERELVKTVGLWGFIPFGLSFMILDILSLSEMNSLGTILIVQGLALFSGARVSQFVKK
ncbi:MAG: hypothetical protein K9N35_02925 [Candidatus Marinimicrobia bacterium]|nr:hypothetical protein [Candidatus Neomarinimicrobiota bacterium]